MCTDLILSYISIASIDTIIILLLGAGGYAKQHLTHSMDRPAPKNPQTFTGLVWNSQFMLDNDGMLSHNRIADFLSHAGKGPFFISGYNIERFHISLSAYMQNVMISMASLWVEHELKRDQKMDLVFKFNFSCFILHKI